jgi:hypothetical protein
MELMELWWNGSAMRDRETGHRAVSRYLQQLDCSSLKLRLAMALMSRTATLFKTWVRVFAGLWNRGRMVPPLHWWAKEGEEEHSSVLSSAAMAEWFCHAGQRDKARGSQLIPRTARLFKPQLRLTMALISRTARLFKAWVRVFAVSWNHGGMVPPLHWWDREGEEEHSSVLCSGTMAE